MRMLLIDCRTADEPALNIENVRAYLAIYDVPIEDCTLHSLPDDLSVFEMVVLFYPSSVESIPALWQENKPDVFLIVALPSMQLPPQLAQFAIFIDPASDGNIYRLMEAIETTPTGNALLMSAMMKHFGFTGQQLSSNRAGRLHPDQRRWLRERLGNSRIGCLYLPAIIFLLLGLFLNSIIPVILLAGVLIWELAVTWRAIRGQCRIRTGSFEVKSSTAKDGTVKREVEFVEGDEGIRLNFIIQPVTWYYWINRKFKVYTVGYFFSDILLGLEPLPLPIIVQPTIGLWSTAAEVSYAGRIHDHLARAYGKNAICTGEMLNASIDQLAVLLLVIGPEWSSSSLLDPAHPDHALLLAASQRKDLTVIPVLVNDAQEPDADTASASQIIPWVSFVRISDYSFTYDLRQLLQTLETQPAMQECLRKHTAERFGFNVADLPANRLGRFAPDQFRQFAAREVLWSAFGISSLGVLIPSLLTVLLLWAGQASFAGLTGGLSLLMLVFSLTIGVIPAYQKRLKVVEGKPIPGGLSASHMGVDGSSLILYLPSALSHRERMEMEQYRYRFYYRTLANSPHLVNIEPIFDDRPEASDQTPASSMDSGQGRILLAIRQPTSLTEALRERLDAIYGTGEVQIVSTVNDVSSCIQRASAVLVGIDADWEQSQGFNTPDDVLCAFVDAAEAQGIPFLPVLLDGAHMPGIPDASHTLSLLGRTNALTLHSYNRNVGLEGIRKWLDDRQVRAARTQMLVDFRIQILADPRTQMLADLLNFSVDSLTEMSEGGTPPPEHIRQIRQALFNLHVIRGGILMGIPLVLATISQQFFIATILLVWATLLGGPIGTLLQISFFSNIKVQEGILDFVPKPRWYYFFIPWTLGTNRESYALLVNGQRIYIFTTLLTPDVMQRLRGLRVRVYYTASVEENFFLGMEPM